MDTSLNPQWAQGYRSKSQMARMLTETWTAAQLYCPTCGWPVLARFPNNMAVADFYCPKCKNEFEQKSKNGNFGTKITDGAYHTFLERICSSQNPHFLMMCYSLEKMKVEQLVLVPKFFFVPQVVEKRKPLAQSAQRAGWVGCNILWDKIPIQGRISIVRNGVPLDKNSVLHQVNRARNFQIDDVTSRGWLMDVLQCINSIPSDLFSLNMVYEFEELLAAKHPDNHNVRAKIRQQLQWLRDRGMLRFLGNGRYQKEAAAQT